jgi:hypothetical protein
MKIARAGTSFSVVPSSQTSDFWFFTFPDLRWRTFAFQILDLLLDSQSTLVDLDPGEGAAALYSAKKVKSFTVGFTFSFSSLLTSSAAVQVHQVYCLFAKSLAEQLDLFNASVDANRAVDTEPSNVFAFLLDQDAQQCAEGAEPDAVSPNTPITPTTTDFLSACYRSSPGRVLLKLTLPGSIAERNLDAIIDAGGLLTLPPMVLVHLDWSGQKEQDSRIVAALQKLGAVYPLVLHRDTEYLPLGLIGLGDVVSQRVTEVLLITQPHWARYADAFQRTVVGEAAEGGDEEASPLSFGGEIADGTLEEGRRLRVLACLAQWGNRNSPEMIKVFETYNREPTLAHRAPNLF